MHVCTTTYRTYCVYGLPCVLCPFYLRALVTSISFRWRCWTVMRLDTRPRWGVVAPWAVRPSVYTFAVYFLCIPLLCHTNGRSTGVTVRRGAPFVDSSVPTDGASRATSGVRVMGELLQTYNCNSCHVGGRNCRRPRHVFASCCLFRGLSNPYTRIEIGSQRYLFFPLPITDVRM